MPKSDNTYSVRFKPETIEKIEDLKEERGWNDSEAIRRLVKEGIERETSEYFQSREVLRPLLLGTPFAVFGFMLFFIAVGAAPINSVPDGVADLLAIFGIGIFAFGLVIFFISFIYHTIRKQFDGSQPFSM